jgi:hypothetical protein
MAIVEYNKEIPNSFLSERYLILLCLIFVVIIPELEKSKLNQFID